MAAIVRSKRPERSRFSVSVALRHDHQQCAEPAQHGHGLEARRRVGSEDSSRSDEADQGGENLVGRFQAHQVLRRRAAAGAAGLHGVHQDGAGALDGTADIAAAAAGLRFPGFGQCFVLGRRRRIMRVWSASAAHTSATARRAGP